jgi:Ni/Co efflux regulator RcnB
VLLNCVPEHLLKPWYASELTGRQESVLLEVSARQFVSANVIKEVLMIMNKSIIVSALIAALLSTSASSFAQDRNYQNDRGARQQEQRGDGFRDRGYNQRDNDRGYRDNDRGNNRRGNDRGNDNARWNERDNHGGNRGAGPRHDLHQGARLPSEYRNKQYVVDDWRGHRLSAPPRGYHWVQTGGDYVLAAVATGLIAQIFLGN